jgi:serine/threonine protein kinase
MFVPYHDRCIAADDWLQFHDAATGLQSLHDHGVIHGNIRPVCRQLLCYLSDLLFFILQENILRNEGRCYLVDFGIAKFLDFSRSFSFSPALAEAQRIPELLDGSVMGRNQHTDIFSFGSTMYQVFRFS